MQMRLKVICASFGLLCRVALDVACSLVRKRWPCWQPSKVKVSRQHKEQLLRHMSQYFNFVSVQTLRARSCFMRACIIENERDRGLHREPDSSLTHDHERSRVHDYRTSSA
jgi:hypothetical protein